MAKMSMSIFKYNLLRKFYMNDWALILGASSGFGAATCKELAKAGINIYGVHLDRRAGMPQVEKLIEELKQYNVNVEFNNMSATDENKRKDTIKYLCKIKNINIKILMHSLAFGALKPMIANDLGCLDKFIASFEVIIFFPSGSIPLKLLGPAPVAMIICLLEYIVSFSFASITLTVFF